VRSKQSACKAQADRAGVSKQTYFMNSIHSFTLNIKNCKIQVDVLDTCSAGHAVNLAYGTEKSKLIRHRILSRVLELLQPSYKAPFIFWVKVWVFLGLLQNNAIVFVSFCLPITCNDSALDEPE